MDDYANHPRTLGELRSDRTGNASDWSPRDVLIAALRRIDSGEWHPDCLIVGGSSRDEKGGRQTMWLTSSPDPLLTVGLAHRIAARVLEAQE